MLMRYRESGFAETGTMGLLLLTSESNVEKRLAE